MNERIKELALQSGAVPLVGHSGLIISNLNVEKFAELIVKECAKVANDNFDKGFCPVGEFITNYFGIKNE